MKTFLNITGVIIKKILALLFLFVLCSVYLFGFVLSANASNVSFTKRGYSDVFDDLREDVSFKAEYFPNMTLDYFNSLNMERQDRSVFRSTCCSCRGSSSGSQHPHESSQLSVTLGSRDPVPSSDLSEHQAHTQDVHIHLQAKHSHT